MENISKWHCLPCNVTFTTNRALRRHENGSRTHFTNINARPDWIIVHKCTPCGKTFGRLPDLRRHLSEQHGDGKKPCPRCDKVIRPSAPHQCLSSSECSSRRASYSSAATADAGFKQSNHSLPTFRYIDAANPTDESVCNYCEEPFEDLSSQALSEHVEKHLNQFTSGLECAHCRIIFQRGHDLMSHLKCAEIYSCCGFDFEHRLPCTGHHRPAAKQYQDRRSFCVRLRSWESEQFQIYRKRIARLATQQAQQSSAHATPEHSNNAVREQWRLQKPNSRLQTPPLRLSLQDGLLNPCAWDGVDHVFDFNEDHLFSHEWNSKDRALYKEFLLLMRNLVRLKVDRTDILDTLQAVTSNPGLLRRLFEWQQITVLNKTGYAKFHVEEVAIFLLEGICRDLGCERVLILDTETADERDYSSPRIALV